MKPFHPAADVYPLLEGEEHANLVSSIRTQGLLHEIVLHEGKVLDGRNRERACAEAGVTPRYVEWDRKGSLEDFVRAQNEHRRHLSKSRRAIYAARLREVLGKSIREIAASQGVSPAYVARAAKLVKENPSLAQEVAEGRVSLPAPPRKTKKDDPAVLVLEVGPELARRFEACAAISNETVNDHGRRALEAWVKVQHARRCREQDREVAQEKGKTAP